MKSEKDTAVKFLRPQTERKPVNDPANISKSIALSRSLSERLARQIVEQAVDNHDYIADLKKRRITRQLYLY